MFLGVWFQRVVSGLCFHLAFLRALRTILCKPFRNWPLSYLYMSMEISRRSFVKETLLVSAGLGLGLDRPTRAAEQSQEAPAPSPVLQKGKIGKLEVSRLILGGNLLTHYTHSRDLQYVYTLAAHYNTEAKILETLAFVEGRGDLSISALVNTQARQLPQGSNVILITASTSLDLIIVTDDLQRRNLRPVVILLVAESFGGAPGSQQIAQQLMEQRVPVCLIYCDADLAHELSSFSSNNATQDATSWQRPTLSHLT